MSGDRPSPSAPSPTSQPPPSPAPLVAPRLPAEWEPHRAVWSAWPHLDYEWGAAYADARAEMAAFFAAAAHDGRGEAVRVLVLDLASDRELRAALGSAPVQTFVGAPFGDSWLRDTGPIFVESAGALVPVCFEFNGWGGKFDMPGDHAVAGFVAEEAHHHGECGPPRRAPLVLEGGAMDADGRGTVLTTRQCCLNENRNPELDRAAVEAAFGTWLGARRVIWLDRGLVNDHTDGHVDTLARFVGPGKVACMRSAGRQDPNHEALEAICATLAEASDAEGRRLERVELPSPGEVKGRGGELLAASYVNFLVTNTRVLVPAYGVPSDAAAVEALRPAFPDREVVGLSARAVVEGGGAFHCITQQQPRGPRARGHRA